MQWTHISHFWSPFFLYFPLSKSSKTWISSVRRENNWFPAVTAASIIHYFYIALFSALMQTHCTHVMWFWLYPFIVHIFNIHGSGVLIATWNWFRLGASSVYTIQPCLSLQCHKHAVFHTTRDSEVIVQETTSPYHSGRKLTHHGIKEADSPWHLARKLTPCQLERKLIHCGIWKGSWLTCYHDNSLIRTGKEVNSPFH